MELGFRASAQLQSFRIFELGHRSFIALLLRHRSNFSCSVSQASVVGRLVVCGCCYGQNPSGVCEYGLLALGLSGGHLAAAVVPNSGS
ncbi:uncharacterized protein G2W53_037345 [Senna tora]|uniref:Uncharacterized protein n=1 Tax=Senna tora TaxID=362788 RepID=A0A834SZ14_9FABA|nr:uncharacterized protein G2W53_037344 [Senna tora]KAF7810602.1 uncharacterized protein G2W53_037345 [Senna tora]